MKKQPTQKPKQTRPRGRPKKTTAGKLAELRLRDTLKQLEATSPPNPAAPNPAAVEGALLELKTLRGPLALRMVANGEAVLISRGLLRRIIEELDK